MISFLSKFKTRLVTQFSGPVSYFFLALAVILFSQIVFWKETWQNKMITYWDKLDFVYPNLLFFVDSLRSGYLAFWSPLSGPGQSIFENISLSSQYTPVSLLYLVLTFFFNPIFSHELVLQAFILVGAIGAFQVLRKLGSTVLPAAMASGLFAVSVFGFLLGQPAFIASLAAFPWLLFFILKITEEQPLVTATHLFFASLLVSILIICGYPFFNLMEFLTAGLVAVGILARTYFLTARRFPTKSFFYLVLFFGVMLIAYLFFTYPGFAYYKNLYADFLGNFYPPDPRIRPPFEVKKLADVPVISALRTLVLGDGWSVGIGLFGLFSLFLGVRHLRRDQWLGFIWILLSALFVVIFYYTSGMTKNATINRWESAPLYLAQAILCLLIGISLNQFRHHGKKEDIYFSLIGVFAFWVLIDFSKMTSLLLVFFGSVLIFSLLSFLKISRLRLLLVLLIFSGSLWEQRNRYLEQYKMPWQTPYRTVGDREPSEHRTVSPLVVSNYRLISQNPEFLFFERTWLYKKEPFSDWYNVVGEPQYFFYKHADFLTNIIGFYGEPKIYRKVTSKVVGDDNGWVRSNAEQVLSLSNKTIAVYDHQSGWISQVPTSNAALSKMEGFRLTPNQIEATLTVPPGGVNLLITQKFHPDWRLRIDQKPAHLFLANLLFMGAGIPEGKHVFKLEFRPRLPILAGLFSYWFLLAGATFYFGRKLFIHFFRGRKRA